MYKITEIDGLRQESALFAGGNAAATGTATDNAGNTNSVTLSPINIDKTKPTVSNLRLSNTVILPILTPSTTITANANDSLSGVIAAEYYIDTDPGQGNATPMTYANGQVSATATPTGLAIGNHTLYVRTQDKAGNWSVPISAQFTYLNIL